MKYALPVFLLFSIAFFSCKKKESKKSGDKLFTFNSLSSNTDSLKQGNVTNIIATVSGSVTYSWSVTAGDVFGNGNNVLFGASTCCVGNHVITCTVKDANDNTESKSVNVFVKQ